MSDIFFCPYCKKEHSLADPNGQTHLPHALDLSDINRAINFVGSAGAWTYITTQTQQYVRDTQVFGVLGDKFPQAAFWGSPDTAAAWLRELPPNTTGPDLPLIFLEGHGAGEVDAIRAVNGSLRGIFYKADFIRDASGHVPSNTPGVDFAVTNRITGQVVEQVQVKASWSHEPQVLRQTIHAFLNNHAYRPEITLAGSHELVEQARQMGVPNRLVVLGDADGNRLSGERLRAMVEQKDLAVAGRITFQGVAERVGQGAVVGAVVGAGLSAIGSYIAFRQGRMTGREAFRRVGIDASKSAIVGGAMGGLSVLFPPGVVGLGIAVLVGRQLRRIIDIAYGEGAFKEIVSSMSAVEASLKNTADGIVVVEQATRFAATAQQSATQDLAAFSQTTVQVDSGLDRLRRFRSGK
jgi:hypothetical protein